MTFLKQFKTQYPGKWNNYIYHPWIQIINENQLSPEVLSFWNNQRLYFIEQCFPAIILGFKTEIKEKHKIRILEWALNFMDYRNQWKKTENPETLKIEKTTKQYVKCLKTVAMKNSYAVSRFAFLPSLLGYFEIFSLMSQNTNKISTFLGPIYNYNVSFIAKKINVDNVAFADIMFLKSDWKTQQKILDVFLESVVSEIALFNQLIKQHETRIKSNR